MKSYTSLSGEEVEIAGLIDEPIAGRHRLVYMVPENDYMVFWIYEDTNGKHYAQKVVYETLQELYQEWG